MNQVTLFHAVKKSLHYARIELLNAKPFISVSGHACSPALHPTQQPVLVSVKPLKCSMPLTKSRLLKVLYASIASAVTKFFGKKGVFYEIVGQEVSGLDGFYDHVWKEYGDIGIEMPANPSGVCNEVYEKLGVQMMLVDANDLGQELLGCSDSITLSEKELLGLIRDNPAGQGRQCTPLILIREKKTTKPSI